MQSAIVQATAEGMPKFNCHQIMTRAWILYRRDTRTSRPRFAKDRKSLFAHCLRTAWVWAKQEAADAMKTMQQRAIERVRELTLDLMRVDGRPWKITTLADRRAIQSEIATLEGRA